jgi:multiple sugar transport system substrate-binding protein
MQTKKISQILLLITLTFGILGTVVSHAQEPVTIKFWTHSYPAREELQAQLIADFMAENPDIVVDAYVGPGDDTLYITELLTALAGGVGPDLFNVVGVGVPDLIPSGAVVPVDFASLGYASQQEIEDQYLAGVLDSFKGADGTLYAFPTELGNYALYINKDLFEAAGLDPVADAPKTWEELLEIAPKLTVKDADGNITQRAFDFPYNIPDEFNSTVIVYAAMAYQLGDGIVSAEDMLTPTVNGAGWAKTMDYVRNYAKEFGGPNYPTSFIGFADESVAMVISGSWYKGVATSINPAIADKVVVAPLPRFADAANDSGSYLYGYGMYVSAQASPEVQVASWKLANYLSQFPVDYFQTAELLQPKLSLVEDESVIGGSFSETFIKDMAGSPALPLVPGASEFTAILGRALEGVTLTDDDIQSILDTANDELNSAIQSAQ